MKEDYTKEYDDIAYPRNTYDECVDYIAEELVKAATMLTTHATYRILSVLHVVRHWHFVRVCFCMQQALCITDKHRRR